MLRIVLMGLRYRNLEPNGYLELQDHAFPLGCDDNTLDGTELKRWGHLMIEAAERAERPINLAPRFQEMMEDAGFVDIVVEKKVWPTNPWAKDPELKLLGRWALAGFEDLHAISMALFTRSFGWSREKTTAFLARVRQSLRDRAIHAYWTV